MTVTADSTARNGRLCASSDTQPRAHDVLVPAPGLGSSLRANGVLRASRVLRAARVLRVSREAVRWPRVVT
ncbi:MAG: hypothetical protein ACLP4R_10320 [Solirubrobacteraceae bacterium]